MELHTPLGREILDLRTGDLITLSGIVYTARDEAHMRMRAEGIPFNPEGAVVYHCGPVVKDERIIAAGPTTSARMNPLTPFLIEKGVRAIIGKGGMDGSVVESLRGRAIYIAEGIDGSSTPGLHPLQRIAQTVGTQGPGVKLKFPAALASLDQQLMLSAAFPVRLGLFRDSGNRFGIGLHL